MRPELWVLCCPQTLPGLGTQGASTTCRFLVVSLACSCCSRDFRSHQGHRGKKPNVTGTGPWRTRTSPSGSWGVQLTGSRGEPLHSRLCFQPEGLKTLPILRTGSQRGPGVLLAPAYDPCVGQEKGLWAVPWEACKEEEAGSTMSPSAGFAAHPALLWLVGLGKAPGRLGHRGAGGLSWAAVDHQSQPQGWGVGSGRPGT